MWFGGAGDAVLLVRRHEIGVALGAAESQGSFLGVFSVLLEDVLGALLCGDGVGQGPFVEAATPPWDVFVVDLIGDADVAKWCEPLALDAFEEIAAVDEVLSA